MPRITKIVQTARGRRALKEARHLIDTEEGIEVRDRNHAIELHQQFPISGTKKKR